ncbi:MAG TPA: hypothetical protein VJT31_31010, partial [Rugosimonospora sp.]|nr:hypothetical protein [Rugosimonospora sp.]
DIALPRGAHRPVTSAPVTWHWFDPTSFDLDRGEMPLGEGTTIGLYGPQRAIIDAIRLRFTSTSMSAIRSGRRPDA